MGKDRYVIEFACEHCRVFGEGRVSEAERGITIFGIDLDPGFHLGPPTRDDRPRSPFEKPDGTDRYGVYCSACKQPVYAKPAGRLW